MFKIDDQVVILEGYTNGQGLPCVGRIRGTEINGLYSVEIFHIGKFGNNATKLLPARSLQIIEPYNYRGIEQDTVLDPVSRADSLAELDESIGFADLHEEPDPPQEDTK